VPDFRLKERSTCVRSRAFIESTTYFDVSWSEKPVSIHWLRCHPALVMVDTVPDLKAENREYQ
jgi:hypothetical protein